MHLCHTKRSDDSMVRQALIAQWGGEAVARGKAKTPRRPLHGVVSHAWSALAVAVTWSDARRVGVVTGIVTTASIAMASWLLEIQVLQILHCRQRALPPIRNDSIPRCGPPASTSRAPTSGSAAARTRFSSMTS